LISAELILGAIALGFTRAELSYIDVLFIALWFLQMFLYVSRDALPTCSYWKYCVLLQPLGVLCFSCTCTYVLFQQDRTLPAVALVIDVHIALLWMALHCCFRHIRDGTNLTWLLTEPCWIVDSSEAPEFPPDQLPLQALASNLDRMTISLVSAAHEHTDIVRARGMLLAAFPPELPPLSAHSYHSSSTVLSGWSADSESFSARSSYPTDFVDSVTSMQSLYDPFAASWSSASSAFDSTTSLRVLNPTMAARLVRAPPRFAFRRTLSPLSGLSSATTSLQQNMDEAYLNSITKASIEAASVLHHRFDDEPLPPPELRHEDDPAFGGPVQPVIVERPFDASTGLGARAHRKFSKRLSISKQLLLDQLDVANSGVFIERKPLLPQTRLDANGMLANAALAQLGLPLPHSSSAYLSQFQSSILLASAMHAVRAPPAAPDHLIPTDSKVQINQSNIASVQVPFFASTRQLQASFSKQPSRIAATPARDEPIIRSSSIDEQMLRSYQAMQGHKNSSAFSSDQNQSMHLMQEILSQYPSLNRLHSTDRNEAVLSAAAVSQFISSQTRFPDPNQLPSRPSFSLQLDVAKQVAQYHIRNVDAPDSLQVPRFTHLQLVPSALGSRPVCSVIRTSRSSHPLWLSAYRKLLSGLNRRSAYVQPDLESANQSPSTSDLNIYSAIAICKLLVVVLVFLVYTGTIFATLAIVLVSLLAIFTFDTVLSTYNAPLLLIFATESLVFLPVAVCISVCALQSHAESVIATILFSFNLLFPICSAHPMGLYVDVVIWASGSVVWLLVVCDSAYLPKFFGSNGVDVALALHRWAALLICSLYSLLASYQNRHALAWLRVPLLRLPASMLQIQV
jgi:hypothetical protein